MLTRLVTEQIIECMEQANFNADDESRLAFLKLTQCNLILCIKNEKKSLIFTFACETHNLESDVMLTFNAKNFHKIDESWFKSNDKLSSEIIVKDEVNEWRIERGKSNGESILSFNLFTDEKLFVITPLTHQKTQKLRAAEFEAIQKIISYIHQHQRNFDCGKLVIKNKQLTYSYLDHEGEQIHQQVDFPYDTKVKLSTTPESLKVFSNLSFSDIKQINLLVLPDSIEVESEGNYVQIPIPTSINQISDKTLQQKTELAYLIINTDLLKVALKQVNVAKLCNANTILYLYINEKTLFLVTIFNGLTHKEPVHIEHNLKAPYSLLEVNLRDFREKIEKNLPPKNIVIKLLTDNENTVLARFDSLEAKEPINKVAYNNISQEDTIMKNIRRICRDITPDNRKQDLLDFF